MELINTQLEDSEIAALVRYLKVSALPFVSGREIKAMPNVSAIYFLEINSVIAYVGESSQMRHRWMSHRHRNRAVIEGGKIFYLTVPNSILLRRSVEAAFIRALRPKLNKKGGSYASWQLAKPDGARPAADAVPYDADGWRVVHVNGCKQIEFAPWALPGLVVGE